MCAQTQLRLDINPLLQLALVNAARLPALPGSWVTTYNDA